MAKRGAGAYMSVGEQSAGITFFLIYLFVLPFATAPIFRFVGQVTGKELSAAMRDMIDYYVLFAASLVIFHGYLARTTRKLGENFAESLKTLIIGLVALYGLNELVYRLTHALVHNRTNLNDVSISAQIHTAPRMTLLIVIFLAPFVEEVLFRGLVFGNLKSHSRILAYTVSCLLFALIHVWQFAVEKRDVTYFWLMVQYLVPGLVLAWTYDRSETLWTSIGLHAAVNALSAWSLWR